jgi:hypothetical protein
VDRWDEACPATDQELRSRDRLLGVEVRRSQSSTPHPREILIPSHLVVNQKSREANNQSRITFPPHPVSVRTTVSFD